MSDRNVHIAFIIIFEFLESCKIDYLFILFYYFLFNLFYHLRIVL